MVRGVIRDLDLGADCVATRDAGKTRIDRCIIDPTALTALLEALAGEPVIAPAWLTLLTVRVVSAALAGHIGAFECTCFEAVFGSLLLNISRKVARRQELVDKCLVLADTVCEHATMVAIVVYTPLNIDRFATCVGDYWL